MKSIFSSWASLSKHAGAMLMVPSVLALSVVGFSFFSWNKQMVQEAPLLDVVMEVRVDLEHAHQLLFKMEKDLNELRSVRDDQEELETLHNRVIAGVDDFVASMQTLKNHLAELSEGTAMMGSVTLSNIEVTKISDDELALKIVDLENTIEILDAHLMPELLGDAYQEFAYSEHDQELFVDAIDSAKVCDGRVHALIKERLDLQRRLFLLLIVVFSALIAYIFFKWRQLNRQMEDSLADIYLTSQATEQLPEPVLIISSGGIIEYGNPAYFEQSGFGATDVIGKHLSTIAVDDHASWVDDVIKNSSERQQWQGEVRTLNRQGGSYGSFIMSSPILDRTLSPTFFLLRQNL
ncbi:PAS domain S-box-containing protein [Mariprofundus ferrinatatus]|uniref:PAS domain S-box-containing protein n=1 Tax=Mariprofundus ferrinatatus TaxID=1921087 RepID=A0A2K8L2M9_9PROT|nr:PAS domain S-box protein [Mariprofundus ferrinatatus]ATX81578.1 PAS domain S-box-containing protein [Mariprofundus ferrinatatus]